MFWPNPNYRRADRQLKMKSLTSLLTVLLIEFGCSFSLRDPDSEVSDCSPDCAASLRYSSFAIVDGRAGRPSDDAQ